jgi:UDP-N-acetylmuramate dehydrogenase
MDADGVYHLLHAADVGRLQLLAGLHAFSTYRLGGPADVLVEPENPAQLARLRGMLTSYRIPHIFLGDGSNIIFDDAGLRGVAVRIGPAMGELRRQGTLVTAGAGISMARLARRLGVWGLGGVEDLAGVPGRLGGMVVMNGGCFRQKIADVVRRVQAIDADGNMKTFDNEACGFDYRTSVFQQSAGCWAVATVEMSLNKTDAGDLQARMLEVLRERRGRFPRYRRLPNCGSVFKNSPLMYERFGPPGKVIEETGCKGWRQGGAEVSERHANFITAARGARAQDVLGLIARVRQAVLDRTGLAMACEVKYVTADGKLCPAHEVGAIPAGR